MNQVNQKDFKCDEVQKKENKMSEEMNKSARDEARKLFNEVASVITPDSMEQTTSHTIVNSPLPQRGKTKKEKKVKVVKNETETTTISTVKLKQFSIKEVMAKLGCDQVTAYGLIKILQHQKLINISGKRKTNIGKGKPENLYSLSENVQDPFGALNSRLFGVL